MGGNERLKAAADKYDQYVREQREYLHEYPELTGAEYETSRYLQEEVQKLGLTVEPLKGTGFVAVLDTGKEGKTLALRADIDALPMQEEGNNLVGPKKCVSKNPGVCHACGHDAHMAILLASIHVLCDIKEDLKGKIVFAFEEGEERGTGIQAMIAALKEKQIDAIYGNHVTAFMDSNTVCLDAGPRMAGAVGIDFTLKGRSGHGSRPDLAVNPIHAGAAILTQLSAAWVNQIDVTKTVTLSVDQFVAGTSRNIIPETAYLGGTCRVFDAGEAKKADALIHKVVASVADMHGCTVEFGPYSKVSCNPVVNDERLAQLAQRGAREILPEDSLLQGITWFASEPFSLYAKEFPAMFAFVGVRNEAVGSGAEHHNVRFDVDEGALKTGVLMMCKFAVDFLEE